MKLERVWIHTYIVLSLDRKSLVRQNNMHSSLKIL